MAKSLKREVVKALKIESAVDMSEFGNLPGLRRTKKLPKPAEGCGTACCLAGHIVLAASRLRMPIPRQKQLSGIMRRDRFGELDCDDVAIAARHIWAQAYGENAAQRLDFYRSPGSFRTSLSTVPAQDVINHVRGAKSTW